MGPAVEIFATGTRDGETWTAADLEQAVANHRLLCHGSRPLHEATIIPGHLEDQELWQKTELPCGGVVDRLWLDGDILKGTFEEIPEEYRDWIRRKLYRTVSAEFLHEDHPDFPPEWKAAGARGWVLRRVALLGAALPKVKGILRLPAEQFADRPRRLGKLNIRRVASGLLRTFAEVLVDRATMEQMAQEAGYGADFLKLLDDATLGALIAEAQRMKVGAAAAADPGASANADAGAPPDRATLIQELVGLGQDPAALEAMTDEDLAALVVQLKQAPDQPGASTNADPAASAAALASQAAGTAGALTPKQVTMRFADIARTAARAESLARSAVAKSSEADRLANQRLAAERKQTIQSFCDQMVKEGRLSPAQVAVDKTTGKPVGPVISRLYRMSSIRKFADRPSELELQMEEIRGQEPVRKFAEVLAQPLANVDDSRRRELLNASPLGRAVLAARAK